MERQILHVDVNNAFLSWTAVELLAKMASDFTKPDRVHTLFEEEIQSKMWVLPVGELFMLGKTVSIQLRTKDFQDASHQGKLTTATSSTKEIYAKAKELLRQLYHKPMEIRLIGVRVDNLTEKEQQQISLFDNKLNEKQEKLDSVVDKIKERYGYNSITRATRLKNKSISDIKE